MKNDFLIELTTNQMLPFLIDFHGNIPTMAERLDCDINTIINRLRKHTPNLYKTELDEKITIDFEKTFCISGLKNYPGLQSLISNFNFYRRMIGRKSSTFAKFPQHYISILDLQSSDIASLRNQLDQDINVNLEIELLLLESGISYEKLMVKSSVLESDINDLIELHDRTILLIDATLKTCIKAHSYHYKYSKLKCQINRIGALIDLKFDKLDFSEIEVNNFLDLTEEILSYQFKAGSRFHFARSGLLFSNLLLKDNNPKKKALIKKWMNILVDIDNRFLNLNFEPDGLPSLKNDPQSPYHNQTSIPE